MLCGDYFDQAHACVVSPFFPFSIKLLTFEYKGLFGCTSIHPNPHVLGVEINQFSTQSTPIPEDFSGLECSQTRP